MRMFVGVAATLTLASGVALAAASLAQNAQQPGVWVSKDGTRTTVVASEVSSSRIDEDAGGPIRCDTWRCSPGAARSWACRCGTWMPIRPRARAAPSSRTCAPGSAAEKAGIKKGDVIAEFDGERVRGVRHLTRLVTETPDGRTVKAAVMREGKRVDLSVTPDSGSWPARTAISKSLVPPMRFEKCRTAAATWPGPCRTCPSGAWAFKGRPGERFGFRTEKGRLGVQHPGARRPARRVLRHVQRRAGQQRGRPTRPPPRRA